MKFFKPEDFCLPYPEQKSDAANQANAKLEREAKKWYSWQAPHLDGQVQAPINIEPLEKCTHTKEKVTEIFEGRLQDQFAGFECSCGVKVVPSGFIAEEK